MRNLNEGLEYGDLARLVSPKLEIDTFRSKMGDDKDIIVIGFTVMSKEPSDDLVSFIEKSYDWVLDADLSSGEIHDGNYLVFVEIERNKKAPKQIVGMLNDITNLTEQDIEDWVFTYYKSSKELPVTEENLTKEMYLTPEAYDRATQPIESVEESAAMNHLKALAGVAVQSRRVTDVQLLAIQTAAGIR